MMSETSCYIGPHHSLTRLYRSVLCRALLCSVILCCIVLCVTSVMVRNGVAVENLESDVYSTFVIPAL